MKTTALYAQARVVLGFAAAGAALLLAPAASAQTSPYYAFTVNNYTALSGTSAFTAADSLNFNNLQINEVFADGFAQPVSLNSATIGEGDSTPSGLQTLTALPGGGYSDATHGALTSALLTGNFAFPGITPDGTGTLSVTVQPTSDPNSAYQQLVYTPFSASLFGAAPAGVPVGTFSLLNLGSSQGTTVIINALPVPAAVPEASTTVSLGLLLALGLGGVVIARRKRTAASH